MTEANTPPAADGPKLLKQVHARIRAKHYDVSRETQYDQWIRRFILFSGKRYSREMGIVKAEAFYPSGGGRQCVGVDVESSLGGSLTPLSRDIGHRFTAAQRCARHHDFCTCAESG
jgi:hypothetical protein